jgi:hypothetical protein
LEFLLKWRVLGSVVGPLPSSFSVFESACSVRKRRGEDLRGVLMGEKEQEWHVSGEAFVWKRTR